MTAPIADNAAESNRCVDIAIEVAREHERSAPKDVISFAVARIILRERELVRAECVATLQKAHAEAERWQVKRKELDGVIERLYKERR